MLKELYTGKILPPNLTSHTIMALLSQTSLNEFTARMQEEVKSIMVKTDSIPGLVDRLDRIESKLKHDTVTTKARLLDLEEDKHELRKQVKAVQDENRNLKSQVKDLSKFKENYVEPIKMEK